MQTVKLEAMHQTEPPPVYNVWNYANCDPRFGENFGDMRLKDHPGRIPGQAIINLLLWLTNPSDVVVDPMAGGGTTIDVCRYLLRRYYCYDIDPRRPEETKTVSEFSETQPKPPWAPGYPYFGDINATLHYEGQSLGTRVRLDPSLISDEGTRVPVRPDET